MKKRIVAVLLLVAILVSCFALTASATTKNKVGTPNGVWKYDCSLLSGNYYSKYKDDSLSWYHPFSVGNYDHASWVRNNKTGATSGWCYAKCSNYSNAQVKASWTGSGSASWWLDPNAC